MNPGISESAPSTPRLKTLEEYIISRKDGDIEKTEEAFGTILNYLKDYAQERYSDETVQDILNTVKDDGDRLERAKNAILGNIEYSEVNGKKLVKLTVPGVFKEFNNTNPSYVTMEGIVSFADFMPDKWVIGASDECDLQGNEINPSSQKGLRRYHITEFLNQHLKTLS